MANAPFVTNPSDLFSESPILKLCLKLTNVHININSPKNPVATPIPAIMGELNKIWPGIVDHLNVFAIIKYK